MKNKQPDGIPIGIEFRSQDERIFYYWCQDAQKKGTISHFEYEPQTYELISKQSTKRIKKLKTKNKIIDKHLCNSLNYTPDFFIKSNQNLESKGLIFFDVSEGVYSYCIDVKGGFTKFNDGVKFAVLQKVFLYTHSIYANKLVVDKWFKKTFIPERRLYKGDLIYKDLKGRVSSLRSRFK